MDPNEIIEDITSFTTPAVNSTALTNFPADGGDATVGNTSQFVPVGLASSSRDAANLFQFRIVPSFYIVLCVIGLIGNGVVIKVLYSILSKNTMRSVTDILVINLATADFVFVGSLPFWATDLFLYKRWIFGTVGCKLMSFITLLNLYGSVFFLVAMGIDRYLAVVYAVRARNYRTPCNAIIACCIIWGLASLIGMEALVFRVSEFTQGKYRCVWKFPDEPAWITAYYVLRVLLGFVLPFLVISFCYILIIIKLHRRARLSVLAGSNLTNKQQKITRAILGVISLFVVCWLPNHIVTVLLAVTAHNPEARRTMDLTTANLVSVCLAYANSSLNPILYAFMKEEIRQQGTEMIVKLFTCCKSTSTNTRTGSKFRFSKRSIWRSTRHTKVVVIRSGPVPAEDKIEKPVENEAEDKPERPNSYDEGQITESKDSADVPSSPDSTDTDAKQVCKLNEVQNPDSVNLIVIATN